MEGLSGFNGGLESPDSMSSMVSKTAVAPADLMVEKNYVSCGAAAEEGEKENDEELAEHEAEEEEDELELGLTLGAKKVAAATGSGGGGCGGGGGVGGRQVAVSWGQYCRILTANDFRSLVSRSSQRTSSTSSVSSSSAANLAGGGASVAGSKRAAESVSPEVGRSPPHPPSQMVVGWPPIGAFRMNSLFNYSKDNNTSSGTETAATLRKANHPGNDIVPIKAGKGDKDQEKKGKTVRSSLFVKVNMDGDPIGRKVDLGAHHSYETLALALEDMFHKPTVTRSSTGHGAKASRLLDGSADLALTYEDRDGDWMLVGDVPWRMFLETAKRLRIMRTSDANGLAPRFQSSSKANEILGIKPS